MFQKRLVAKCAVIQNDNKLPCNIFELDSSDSEDIDYFEQFCGQGAWKNSWYLGSIGNDLYIGTTAKVYTMENEQG